MKPFKFFILTGVFTTGIFTGVFTGIFTGVFAFATVVYATESLAPESLAPIRAIDVTPDSFLWQKRPILVFADTADDPNFLRQIELLARDPADLIERDAVVIIDTDPQLRSAFRLKLRPRGFSLVILDKDGAPELRKPMPWTSREITRAIDKFPLRRQEMLEQRPAGR
jgi:hypothetical protein